MQAAPRTNHWLLVLLLLFALQAALLLAPISGLAISLTDYLPLHTALETLAIVIAGLIFATIWSVRNEHPAPGIIVLGCTFLGSALFDFSHMLSYSGMPDYVTPGSPEKAILFWLAARYLGAVGLLSFAWLQSRPQQHKLRPVPVLVLALALVALAHVAILDRATWLPDTFVTGQGLTAFKVRAEYVLMLLYGLAALRLWQYRRSSGSGNADQFFMAACLTAMSEFFFTRYAEVSDIYNMTGHLYKVLAYGFLYQAAFVNTVRQPYALLRTTTAQQQAVLKALPDLLFVMDEEGHYLEVHPGSADGLLSAAGGLVGKSIHDMMPGNQANTVLSALQEAKSQGLSRGKIIVLDMPNGQRRSFELSVAHAPGPREERARLIVISRDVTERENAADSLRLTSYAMAQSPVPIVVATPDGNISYVNDAFTHASGYSTADILGRNPRLLASGNTTEATYQAMWSRLLQGKPWRGELSNRTKAGNEIIESVVIYPLRDSEGKTTHYISYQLDVTAERRAFDRIEHLVNYDQLTGLPSRRLLLTRFAQLRQQHPSFALFWLDLDHFKDINDALGHHVGDMLLCETALRLSACLGEEGMVSRHSGDEFTLLLPLEAKEHAAQVAQRLLSALDQTMQLAEHSISTTASIGIALYPSDGADFETLLKNAEAAAYETKNQGRNGWNFFTTQMRQHSARMLGLGNALKQALANGELHLAYQPQQDLHTGTIIGAEALLRWTHPQWGDVSPAEFIPIAEANGQIIAIGTWVLRTALAQLREWLDAGLPPMVLAVNLSAVQFGQANLPELVRQALQETRVPASLLALELTEAVALKAPNAAAQHMRDLRALGVQLAIDDFGTGYSSLSYLKRFKIHKLKIDQSFVRDILMNSDDQAIVVAIIQLAQGLGIRTIAEGVETAEQQKFLSAHGCAEIQGYHLSRPLPAAQLSQFVSDR